MTIGPLVAAVGLGLLLRTRIDSPYLTVLLPAFIVLAGGMALTMTPMTSAVMSSVEVRHAGVASAATNTSREIGGVFGIALLGAIVTSAFTRGFTARLLQAGIPKAQVSAIVARAGASAAAGAGGSLPRLQQQVVKESFVHAIHVGVLVAVAFMILASVVSVIFVRSHVAPQRGPEGAEGHEAEVAARGH
jgi:hypothetical protein